MEDIQVGTIGADIIVQLRDGTGTVKDLSNTTTRYIYLTPPTGRTRKRFTAALVSTGTNGQMKYTTTTANDLNVPGNWRIQAYYVNTAGSYWSQVGYLNILPNSA